MIKEKIQCDICNKGYYLTPKQKYDLDFKGFIIYCQDCADKLRLDKKKSHISMIKIYKM